MAALFLYRKIAKEPIEEHVLVSGPEVGATEAEMKVRACLPTSVAASFCCPCQMYLLPKSAPVL